MNVMMKLMLVKGFSRKCFAKLKMTENKVNVKPQAQAINLPSF